MRPVNVIDVKPDYDKLDPEAAEERFNVLVLDRHEAARLGIGLMLQHQTWVNRCFMASEPEEAFSQLGGEPVDVALVEVSSYQPFLRSVIGRLRDGARNVRIVLCSGCRITAPTPVKLPGTVDALGPESSNAEVLEALHRAGHATVPRLAPPPSEELLTPRETLILTCLATGATNREIANRLCLSHETVKKHARNVYRKLGVRNRTEATQWAATHLRHSPAGVS